MKRINVKATENLIKMLRANGVITYKTPDLEMVIRPTEYTQPPLTKEEKDKQDDELLFWSTQQ